MISVVVTSNLQTFHSERRFPGDLSIESLKQKLELLTGANPLTMQIELHNKDDVFLRSLKDKRNTTLIECGIEDEMIIHVKDDSQTMTEPDSSDAVAKFEISDEAYEQRGANVHLDSVRAWKQRQQLGRFNPEAQKLKEEHEQQFVIESKQLAAGIKPDDRCEVRLTNQPPKRGRVAFVGEAHFRPGTFIGVVYDEPVGKNDGTVQGKKYFECLPNYGGFVRPQDVHIGDYPELSIEDEMEEI